MVNKHIFEIFNLISNCGNENLNHNKKPSFSSDTIPIRSAKLKGLINPCVEQPELLYNIGGNVN